MAGTTDISSSRLRTLEWIKGRIYAVALFQGVQLHREFHGSGRERFLVFETIRTLQNLLGRLHVLVSVVPPDDAPPSPFASDAERERYWRSLNQPDPKQVEFWSGQGFAPSRNRPELMFLDTNAVPNMEPQDASVTDLERTVALTSFKFA